MEAFGGTKFISHFLILLILSLFFIPSYGINWDALWTAIIKGTGISKLFVPNVAPVVIIIIIFCGGGGGGVCGVARVGSN